MASLKRKQIPFADRPRGQSAFRSGDRTETFRTKRRSADRAVDKPGTTEDYYNELRSLFPPGVDMRDIIDAIEKSRRAATGRTR